MDNLAFNKFCNLIQKYKPTSYIEIGCHNGFSARQVCLEMLKYCPELNYIGFDAFSEVDWTELNGKSKSTENHKNKINQRLNNLLITNPKFKFKIIEGLTTQTITSPIYADFVYIDGGHSYDTVMHDYNMTKESKIIILDDYNYPGVEKAVAEIGKGTLFFSHPSHKNKKWIIFNP